jgi:hypothetical protein
MIPRRWIFIAFLFSCHCLSACGPLTIKDTTTQSFVPIQRGVLELHQDLVIPANRTRVFLQDGRVLHGINEYYPHCQLRVRNIMEHPQPVQADRFTIDKVFGTLDQVVSSEPVRLAAVGSTVIAGGGGGNGGGNGEGRQLYMYFMALHSDQQPQVTYLVCGGALEEPAFADYPSLQDIQTALGDYATLTLNGDD